MLWGRGTPVLLLQFERKNRKFIALKIAGPSFRRSGAQLATTSSGQMKNGHEGWLFQMQPGGAYGHWKG
jgi:hypothetical protein